VGFIVFFKAFLKKTNRCFFIWVQLHQA